MTRRQQLVDIAVTWLVLALVYRLGLQAQLHDTFLWTGAWQDVLLALAMTAIVAPLNPRLALVATAALLLVLGLDAQINSHLLPAMRIALDRPTLRDALASDDWQLLQTADLRDVLMVLTPVALLFTLRALPRGRAQPIVAALLALVLALGRLWAAPRPPDWPEDAAQTPIAALLLPPPEVVETQLPLEATTTVQVPLPLPPTVTAQAVPLPEAPTVAYNVVWIVMESTGTRYFEGAFHRDPLPMPTLRRLAAEGWYLARHQSPSNSSATSIFAQFSGLYPSPQTQMFATQADNWVPALPSYLPASYARFLYTPGRLNFFFPQAFLRHSGLTEMVGYDETEVDKNVGIARMSKDEIETVTTFLARLHTAPEPFLGIYYSFSPHWPYTDYGAKWHRYPGNQPLEHYHNALWLLDQQIARIIEQLRADGRLDHTILVLAGDHGEAFGQHEHNWAHARGSFQENFETPAIFWQPRIFKPRVVTEATSHIDLLPTLLDALHVPFDRKALQGQSLWQAHEPRALQFAWSNEGMATVTTAAGVKLSWAVDESRCRVFDLQADPQEKHARPCKEQPELLAKLKAWREAQRALVKARSEARRKAVE